jgi:hypothetical protein
MSFWSAFHWVHEGMTLLTAWKKIEELQSSTTKPEKSVIWNKKYILTSMIEKWE